MNPPAADRNVVFVAYDGIQALDLTPVHTLVVPGGFGAQEAFERVIEFAAHRQ